MQPTHTPLLRFTIQVICTIMACMAYTSCGPSQEEIRRQTELRNRPQWVKERPTDVSHYIGIGIVSKKRHPYDYAKRGKNSALDELSGEISSNISSTTTLSSVEASGAFFENIQSNIKVKNKLFLEGYEQVATYENDDTYWVWYKLDKRKYQALKEKRMQELVSKSKDLIQRADEAKSTHDYRAAWVGYMKAMQTIEPFWGEVLKTEIKGEEVYLKNVLTTKIFDLNQDIIIRPSTERIDVTRGYPISSGMLRFSASTIDGFLLTNLPLAAEYSLHSLSQSEYTSGANGDVRVSIAKARGRADIGTLEMKLDTDKLAKEAGLGFTMKQVLSKLPSSVGRMKVYLSNPSISLEVVRSTEQLETFSTYLTNALARKDVLIKNEMNTDFSLKVSGSDQQTTMSNGLSKNTFSANVDVYSKGKKIATIPVNQIEVVGQTPSKSLSKLQKNMADEARLRTANKVYEVIFKH